MLKVETAIEWGWCEDCDMDPARCYLRGECFYEQDEEYDPDDKLQQDEEE